MANSCDLDGGCGCISIVFFFILIWALIFGFTWNGIHYDMDYNQERGVEFIQERAE